MATKATTGRELGQSVTVDGDLIAMLEEVFDDYRAGRGEPCAEVDLDHELWDQLARLGLTRMTGPESTGGSAASWAEATTLLGLSAAAAAPVPLAEHDLLAGWLADTAGLPHSDDIRTVARPGADGVAHGVPWARSAGGLVTIWEAPDGWRVAQFERDRATLEQRRNIAGEPADTVTFEVAGLAAGVRVASSVARELHLRGALARCAQNAGSMARVLEVVLRHVGERVQFGRSLGAFQAVQALVADLAAEAALARASTDAAVTRVVTQGWDDQSSQVAVAVAASCVGHAASVVVRNAHQALGAIGATLEHELPQLTKPILARRGEFGSVDDWDRQLTDIAVRAGRDGLWPLLTS